MGIWKDIYIQGYSTAVVRDIIINAFPVNNSNDSNIREYDFEKMKYMDPDEQLIYKAYFNKYKDSIDYTKWKTEVIVFIDAGQNNVLYPKIENASLKGVNITGTVQIYIDGLDKTCSKDITIMQGTEVNVTVDCGIIDDVEIWMPNKFGNQKMYNFRANFIVDYLRDNGIMKEFGFRTVELIQDPLPGGTAFYFRINGVNVPMHGSNWVPSYALDNSNYSVNTASMEPIFIALYNSNQNMMRVKCI